MFYREEDISDILNCPRCSNRYVEPKILPCFNTLCVNCVDELTLDDEFSCYFCRVNHQIPKEGFQANAHLNRLLGIKPNDVYRNKMVRELGEKLKQLKVLSDRLESAENDAETLLDEHCRLIRNKIDLACERKINEINEIRCECVKYVDEYREKCLQNINQNKPHLTDRHRKANVELKKYLDEWTRYLKDFHVDELVVQRQNRETDFKIYELERLLNDIRLVQFNGEMLEFEDENESHSNRTTARDVIFGRFKYSKLPENKITKVASGANDKTIKVWSLETGECIRTLEGHSNNVYCLCAVDKDTLVSGSEDKTIKVWSLKTGTCTRTIEGHTEYVYCMCALSKSEIVTGAGDKTIRIWNLNTGSCVQTLKGHTGEVWCVIAYGENKIISGSKDNTVRVWDLDAGGVCVQTLEGHNKYVRCLSLIDANRLVTGSEDKTLKVWNLDNEQGGCVQTLHGHKSPVWCLIAVNDAQIASGSKDETIKIWNLLDGSCILTLQGHESTVVCLLSLSKNTLLSGSSDNTIKEWNLESGNCVQTLKGHSNYVRCLSYLIPKYS